MPEGILRFLIDQNIPYAVSAWLKSQRPAWLIQHVKDLGFEGKPDSDLYKWAQANEAIVITYDEDFADSRLYPLGSHPRRDPSQGLADYNRKYSKSTFPITTANTR